jgi:hypothetical protein
LCKLKIYDQNSHRWRVHSDLPLAIAHINVTSFGRLCLTEAKGHGAASVGRRWRRRDIEYIIKMCLWWTCRKRGGRTGLAVDATDAERLLTFSCRTTTAGTRTPTFSLSRFRPRQSRVALLDPLNLDRMIGDVCEWMLYHSRFLAPLSLSQSLVCNALVKHCRISPSHHLTSREPAHSECSIAGTSFRAPPSSRPVGTRIDQCCRCTLCHVGKCELHSAISPLRNADGSFMTSSRSMSTSWGNISWSRRRLWSGLWSWSVSVRGCFRRGRCRSEAAATATAKGHRHVTGER